MRPLSSATDDPLPALYLTDANSYFAACSGAAALLQAFTLEGPRFLLIGIGYPGDSPVAGECLRTRDLALPGFPDFATGHPAYAALDGMLEPEDRMTFGAAPAFQQFLCDDLIPRVESRYATLPSERAFFGHSLGGAFGLHAALTRPEVFRNLILSSPALTYDGVTPSGIEHRDMDLLLGRTLTAASQGTIAPNTRVFLSVGSEEEFEPGLANWRFTSSCHRLAAILRTASLQAFKFEAFPGERHATSPLLAFSHGVQFLFAGALQAAHQAKS